MATAIVLCFVALAVPYFLRPFDKAGARPKVDADLMAIEAALLDYAEQNHGRYPAAIAELLALDANGRRYFPMSRIPRDPWKSEYVYVAPSVSGGKPSVFSRGPDGKPGTDDDIRLDDE